MKKILTIILLFSLSFQVRASHLMGGEITWVCQPNGQFVFTMILYRDCSGIPIPTGAQSLEVYGNPLMTSLSLPNWSTTDITYCQPQYNCNNAPPGATEQGVYVSNPITLNGVPPAGGWTFVWHSCCRNAALDNVNAAGFSLRATMFPYNGQNVNPCFDSSPAFAERPNTVLCTGFPFKYNHVAIDPEMDSLVYAWGQPLEEPTNTPPAAWNPGTNPSYTTYNPPYSVANPLPFNAPNVGATINPFNGEINYACYIGGNFLTCTKVTAYKCGQKVAEIFREIQIVMLGNCPLTFTGTPNAPPVVDPPFQDSTGAFTQYNDTVYAGDTVRFFLNAHDFDFVVVNGVPQLQSLDVMGYSGQFGAGFTNPNAGCLIPPCATTSPALPSVGNIAGSNIAFTWPTTCDHVIGFNQGCVKLSNTYTFFFRNQDNFCPAPQIAYSTITITVLAPPAIDSSQIRCTAVGLAGDVTLTWAKAYDKKTPNDTAASFYCYQIWRAPAAAGPYTLIDSIFNINTTSYTDNAVNGQTGRYWYYSRTRYGCDGDWKTGNTDSVSTILLNVSSVTPGIAQLNWNAIHTPLFSSSLPHYKIYRESPPTVWTLIDSTTSLSYIDTVSIICNDSINYRVQIEDSIGCTSVSSIDGIRFSIAPQPDPPSLRCIAVQVNGSQTLTWVPPVDTAVQYDGYFIYHANGAVYTLHDSLFNYSTLTYNDNSLNANNNSVGHFLTTRSACGPAYSINGDTLKSIYLQVNNVGGNASLSWNAMRTPKLPSAGSYYRIFKEYPAGSWSLIDSTSLLTYLDSIYICNDSINYRIELPDASGCISVSNVDGARFIDNSIPDPPEIRCVAVATNGDVTISWSPPQDTGLDFNSYHIYYSLNAGGPFNLIDSIFNYNQSSYTHTVTAANGQSVYYQMKTRTGCGVQYSPASATARSIYLTVGGTNTSIAALSWNAVHTPNLPTSTGTYNIYRKVATGPWAFRASTNSLSFNDSLVICIDSVFYRIEIGDALPCVSVSNVNGNRFVDNTVPAPPAMHCISVLPNGNINLTWVPPTDTARQFNSYHIFSSLNAAGPYIKVDSIFNYNATTYTDITANGNAQSVYYYLETRSGCGVQYSSISEILQSIYLQVGGGGTSVANLSWNAIHTPNLPSSTGVYKVFREYPAGTWNQIGSTPSLSYDDSLHLCTDRVNYRVEISDNLPCVSVSSVNGDIFVDNTIPGSPEPRCVSVLTNGDVTITWQAPVDTGLDFNSYHIYTSNNPGGPFIEIDSIFDYGTTTTTHLGANANNQSVYYILKTRTGCGVQYSPASVLIQSIKLNVTNPGNGVANLNWNPTHNPLLPTASATYDVYKEYPAGTWAKIATVGEPHYEDSITVCSETINYYVETFDNLPCNSVSSRDGDLFQDIIPPSIPVLDTVSVNPYDSLVTITWNQNPSGDTKGYIIYQFNGVTWDSVGATTSISAISLLNLNSQAAQESEIYAVAAYDSCGNLSPLSVQHNTIFLQVQLNKCKGAIDLEWVAYQNMESGVAKYNIFASENGGPYLMVGSTAGNETTFSHGPLTKYATYCYFVQAVSTNGLHTASSNIACEFADVLQLPLFSYLKKVTVTGPRSVYGECFVDTAADVTSYRLMRSMKLAGPYSTVALSYDTLNPVISFNDTTPITTETDYFYIVITTSNCGVDVYTSNIGHTIYLQAKPQDNFINTLEWNNYEEWLGKVQHYKIYRKVDNAPVFEQIADVPYGITTYVDHIPQFYMGEGNFCYYVEAYEGAGNAFGFSEISASNEDCAIQSPQLYVPNAFTPGGKNPVFYPVNIFTDENNNYFFSVFNRWGEKIFETHDPKQGWDGKFNGTLAPQGTYVYYVRLYGNSGEKREKKGWVNLIR